MSSIKAERILLGCIYTADAAGSFAEALAIAGGKLLYVGSREGAEAYRGPETLVETREGLIIPAMTEGHAHVTCSSEFLCGIPLGVQTDPQVYLDTIRAYMEAHPQEERIFGSGYDNGVFGPQGPTAALLDRVSTEKPIVMVASDHHSRWLNSKALAICGITAQTPDPRNGEVVRCPDGSPTGWLKEQAMTLANPACPVFSPELYAKAVSWYQDLALSQGIANVFEPIYDPLQDYAARTQGWQLLDRSGSLYLTGCLGWTMPSPESIAPMLAGMAELEKESSPHVHLTTAKFFVDGVVECHTAVLREAYADAPGDRGKPIMATEEFAEGMTAALDMGLDIHVHVIGDRASDIAMDALEAAQKAAAPREFRNALTHLQLLQPDQIRRMAELGLTAVVNPYWHFFNPVYYDALELPYLGAARARKQYPVASLLAAGIPMSQASDFPVTVPPASMVSLHLMVNRRDPDHSGLPALNPVECLTVRQALDVLTIGGARQLRLEDRKGSLEAGKDADFVLLDRDVFRVAPDTLSQTRILETWIAGVCRFSRP